MRTGQPNLKISVKFTISDINVHIVEHFLLKHQSNLYFSQNKNQKKIEKEKNP